MHCLGFKTSDVFLLSVTTYTMYHILAYNVPYSCLIFQHIPGAHSLIQMNEFKFQLKLSVCKNK